MLWLRASPPPSRQSMTVGCHACKSAFRRPGVLRHLALKHSGRLPQKTRVHLLHVSKENGIGEVNLAFEEFVEIKRLIIDFCAIQHGFQQVVLLITLQLALVGQRRDVHELGLNAEAFACGRHDYAESVLACFNVFELHFVSPCLVDIIITRRDGNEKSPVRGLFCWWFRKRHPVSYILTTDI
nr:MAG TPA: hypothetical protein [Caudoviricetes sp.]